MTTGARALARRSLAVMLAVAAWAPAPAAELGLEELMRDLGRVQSSEGRFTERKHLSILEAPLESSGTLVYTAPGRLEKRTLRPRPESLLLDGDRLTIEGGARDGRRVFFLQEHPVIWAFVESIRSTLAGDLKTLNRFYEVRLEGSQSRWRLILTPSEPQMRGVVSEIRISGRGTWIDGIDIVETGGDRSVMTITRDAS